MPRLVVRRTSLLLGRDHDLAGGTEHDPLDRVGEVDALDRLVVTTGGQQRGLVDEVLQLGADHARRRGRDVVERNRGGQRHVPGVHLENAPTTVPIRRVHDNAAVEPSRSEECRVEDLGTVGGGQYHHALVPRETVHLGEDLVERLLALVVTTEVDRPTPGPPDRVELVDEDDRRRHLLRLFEQVAHPARADTDDHLDELRSGDRQERHGRLARHRPREQCLAGAGRTGEEHASGDLGSEPAEPVGVPEELDDLHDFVLDLVDPGDVGEGRSATRLRLVQACPRAPEPAETTAGRHRGAPEHPHEQSDDEQGRQEGEEDLGQGRTGRLRLGGDLHSTVEQLLDETVVRERGPFRLEVGHLRRGLAALRVPDLVLEGTGDRVARGGDVGHVAIYHLLMEERIRNGCPFGFLVAGDDDRHDDPVHDEQEQQEPPEATYHLLPVGRLALVLVVMLGHALRAPRLGPTVVPAVTRRRRITRRWRG